MSTPNERLRQARIAAGFQHARSAAERFGWPDPTYRSHENGARSFFDIADAERYAKAFRVPLHWLLGLSADPQLSIVRQPSVEAMTEVLAAAMRVAGIKPPSLPLLQEVAGIVRETLEALGEDQALGDDPSHSGVVTRTIALRRRRLAS